MVTTAQPQNRMNSPILSCPADRTPETQMHFIRTAIRNQLTTHAEEVRQTVARKTLVLGLQDYSRRDLEAVREVEISWSGGACTG